MKPTFSSEKKDNVKIIDVKNFTAARKISAGIVALKPGAIRELH